MNIRLSRLIIILLSLPLGLVLGCSEEFKYVEDTAVKTSGVNDVSYTTATVWGTVNTDNGTKLSARGICYSTSASPTISNNKKLDDESKTGIFSCSLENLNPDTTYYARAFATNIYGVAYGEEVTFSTQESKTPILSTITVSSMTTTGATLSGNITYSGKSSVTSRGFCYSTTTTTPTTSDTKVTNSYTGTGTFSNTITGLTKGKRYYVRAFATNIYGTVYSNNVVNFTL